MIRLIWRLAVLAALAALFAWLADRPGVVTVRWLGLEIEAPVLAAVGAVLLAFAVLWFVWSFLSRLWRAPEAVGGYLRYRRTRRGYESLSRGIVAAGAGDGAAAQRHAQYAARNLTDEPLVRLLEAQAAQLRGDHAGVGRVFAAMLEAPETQALGLRGLYAEAQRAGDSARARELAERALKLNPSLGWASAGLLSLQAAAKDWAGATATIEGQRRSGAIDKTAADRKRAALLAAQALAAEPVDRDRAFTLAVEAHRLDPALVPAAAVAARIEAQLGNTKRAMKVLRRTWQASPHPDLAEAAAAARLADRPENRLARVRDLLSVEAGGTEGRVALARAALEARQWDVARSALEPLLDGRPQARVCGLMADLEEGESGDKGRAREWLARARRASPDPLWVIDGMVSPVWLPASPVTAEIGTCVWKVPFEALPAAEPEPPEADPEPEPLAEPAAPMAIEPPPSPALVEPPPPPEPFAAELPRQPDDPGPDRRSRRRFGG